MGSFIQSMKTRLIAAIAVIVLLGAAGAWWYFAYYTKTPEYALQAVQEAVVAHDKDKVYKYADMEHLLDTASNDMMDGLIRMMIPVTGDTQDAVSGWAQMFKAPVVMSLQNAADNFILYGSWSSGKEDSGMNTTVDADMIVQRIGLTSLQFVKLESVAADGENGTANAMVRVLQTETNEEFVLNVELIETEDGTWRVYEIVNFRDFVEEMHKMRQKLLKDYLDSSAALMQQHDAAIAAADSEISGILANGSLGSNATRQELKQVLTEKTIPDWEQRKAELEAMEVPEAAGTLHRLRIKICNAHIESAKGYAAWMDDKKAATIRASDSSLKIAKTLEKEAEFLVKQVDVPSSENT